jgi:hypothetical protein
MKREGFLATLSLMGLLLLPEFDHYEDEYGLIDSLWVGVIEMASNVIGYYCVLTSVTISVVTTLAALFTKTPSRVIAPTVFVGIGLLFYMINRLIFYRWKWLNLHSNKTTDGSIIPEQFRVPYYLCHLIPALTFTVCIVPYSIAIYFMHIDTKIKMDKLGIKFDDAESSDFPLLVAANRGTGLAKGVCDTRGGLARSILYVPLPQRV